MSEPLGYIYRIYRLEDNKSYIGKTTDLKIRMFAHLSPSNRDISEFSEDIYLLGFEAFGLEILEKCQRQFLTRKETYWIQKFNTCQGFGYNLTDGAGNKKYKGDQSKIKRKIVKRTSWINNSIKQAELDYQKKNPDTNKIDKIDKEDVREIKNDKDIINIDPYQHPIRKMREERLLTLKQVGDRIGIHEQTVARWEREFPPHISYRNRQKFEEEFGFNPVSAFEELLKDAE